MRERLGAVMVACAVAACAGKSSGAEDVCDRCAAGAVCDADAAEPCSCPTGSTGDGTAAGTGCTPEEVDACEAQIDDCVAEATCVHTLNGFTCACRAGYSGDGAASGTGCTDIDECAAGSDDCGTLDCTNSVGSFTCWAWLAPRPYQGFIDRMDSSFRLLDRMEVTSASGQVDGIAAMAVDPTDQTLFAVVKVAEMGRFLATIDPATGDAAERGHLGDNFSSLAFDATGQLWGVTGDGAAVPETLFRIDKADATATAARALGAGTDGECVAFHPAQNALYHWSGAAVVVERIDLADPELAITPIPATGTPSAEPHGCLYDPALDAFRVWDGNATVRTMTADGAFGAALFTTTGTIRTSLFRPTVGHAVAPAEGPTGGGTAITLTGVGLDLHGPGPALSIGGAPATEVRVVDENTITAVTPAGAVGSADVILSGTGPDPYAWPGGFTYEPSPARPAAWRRRQKP